MVLSCEPPLNYHLEDLLQKYLIFEDLHKNVYFKTFETLMFLFDIQDSIEETYSSSNNSRGIFFSRPSPKAGSELQTELDRIMER